MSRADTFGFAYIEEFRCLADKCPDSCCHEWPIHISEPKAESYRTHYPDLYELIVKENNEFVMRREGTQCSANDCGLCRVHRDYGEAVLSDTCIDYPRMYRSNNGHYMRSGTMSCPEVARKCLFDDNPFQIMATQLSENHPNGEGLSDSQIDTVEGAQWRQIVESLLNKVLDEEHSAESVLQSLLMLAPSMDAAEIKDWPEAISNLSPHQQSLSSANVSDHQYAENSTQLLMVLLEHLERNGLNESYRQEVVTSYNIITNDPESLRCQLKPIYKEYYEKHSAAWLPAILKRFVAAEMTRIGFPFVSPTFIGQDYGKNLYEWSLTLAVRTLSLRLFLVITATNQAMNTSALIPENDQLVDWVYRFCRKVNHNIAGPNERGMRESDLKENHLAPLWDFFSM